MNTSLTQTYTYITYQGLLMFCIQEDINLTNRREEVQRLRMARANFAGLIE